MIPTIAKRWINLVDVKVFLGWKGKNWTWTVPHERFVDPVEKNIMLFDFESLHLLQPYIKSINFPRDEGEN